MQAIAGVLIDKFVARNDVYAVQLPGGGYTKVGEPLTRAVIEEHLRGKRTVGVYQLSQDSKVKWLCLDIDPEKINDPAGAAGAILNACFERKKCSDGIERPRIWRRSVLLEASRHPDPSYHVWILFLLPVPAKVARWLGIRILEIANLDPRSVEVFPKQTNISGHSPYGNLVKLPLGLHQVERKWSRFLDFETFEPLPNTILLDKIGLSFMEADLEKIMSFRDKRHIQTALNMPMELKPLQEEDEEKTAEILAKYWRRGSRNRLEMAFLGLCLKRGVAYDSARRIIEKVCDLTGDEERASRLRLVDYHYSSRRQLGEALAGASIIREVIREVIKEVSV